MFEVRNERDLKIAHLIVHELKKEGRRAEHVADLKREIREYNKREEDRRIVASDFDWALWLITFPEFIQTKDEAEEWFEAKEKVEFIPGPWDCSGNPFTSDHHCFERNGRWYCYHRINYDL